VAFKSHSYSVCSIVISLSAVYAQAFLALMQADGSTVEAADAIGLQSFSGLSLQEENDMRLEHALDILKADVSFALRSCQSQLHEMDSLGNIYEVASQSDMQLPL